MAQECGFFNAKPIGESEYDRVYSAEQFAAYFASFIGNGIFGKSMQKLEVMEQEKPDMSIKVLPGEAWINGWWYRNTEAYTLSLDVADGVLNRTDVIVLRWGSQEREMWLQVIKGVSSLRPTIPNIRRDADYYDLQLAVVSIPKGTVKITQALINDTRLATDLCGLVTGVVDQIDTTNLYNQFESYFENFKETNEADFIEWFKNIRDKLIGDPAGILYEHIENRLNPHEVTKTQVGLSNVDNTSDINKPVSAEQRTAINLAYQEAVDYTDNKIASLIDNAPETLDTLKEVADAIEENETVVEALNAAIGSKVDKSEFIEHSINVSETFAQYGGRISALSSGKADKNEVEEKLDKMNSDIVDNYSSIRSLSASNSAAHESFQNQLLGKANASHTHDYLPLTGGTINGDVKADNFETDHLTNERYTSMSKDGFNFHAPITAYAGGLTIYSHSGTELVTIGAYGKDSSFDNSIISLYMGLSYQNPWLKVTPTETTAPKFVGSFTGDLVGNAYSLNGCIIVDNRTNQTSNPWNHFCTIQAMSSYANVNGSILVQDTYGYPGDRFGILTYNLRSNGDNTMRYFTLEWNFAANTDLLNRVVAVVTKNDTTGIIVTLWYKIPDQYYGCNFVHLSNAFNRGDRNNFNHITFYERTDAGVPSLPSGTQIEPTVQIIVNPTTQVVDYSNTNESIKIGWGGAAIDASIGSPIIGYRDSSDGNQPKYKDTNWGSFLKQMGSSASVGSEITYASASELSVGKITVSGLFNNYKVILATITSSKYGTHQYVLPMPFIKARGNSGYQIKSTGQSSATTTDQINFLYVDDNSIRWFEYQSQGSATYSYASFIKLF